jgi:class 3 adenylate cyclase
VTDVNDLPDGTVTFFFTDVEGSTRLLKQLESAYGDLLGRHHELVREAVAAYGGREVDTQGEAFFVAFRRAKDAVGAAVQLQLAHAAEPWPHGVEVRVRVGIHTAEPERSPSGYFGMGLHRAARICAVCHGRQVLVSRSTAGLVDEDEQPGLRVRDLGEHLLKDLERPERIYQVMAPGLEAEFPPIRSLTALARAGEDAGLPTGTVTFLATDLEGHGALVRSHDTARLVAIMEQYEHAIRAATAAAGGEVFEWVGDSCIAVFREAARAVSAAVDALRRVQVADWPDGHSPGVRIGLHTGEAARWRSGYVGLALIRTLRVCNAAEPGHAVASPTTESVLSGIGIPGIRLRALAPRELEDFEGPVVLHELLADADTAPALRLVAPG